MKKLLFKLTAFSLFVPFMVFAACGLNTNSASFIRTNGVYRNSSNLGADMASVHSVNFWINIPTNPTLNNNFFIYWIAQGGHAEELLEYSNVSGVMQFIYRRVNNITGTNTTYIVDISGTGWHMITTVDNGTNNLLYVDKVQQASAATLADGDAGDNYSSIGENAIGGTQGMTGLVDDFRVYGTHVLSAGEISALFDSPSNVDSSVPNLTAGYTFNSDLTSDVTGTYTLTSEGSPSQSASVPFAGTVCPVSANYSDDDWWSWFLSLF